MEAAEVMVDLKPKPVSRVVYDVLWRRGLEMAPQWSREWLQYKSGKDLDDAMWHLSKQLNGQEDLSMSFDLDEGVTIIERALEVTKEEALALIMHANRERWVSVGTQGHYEGRWPNRRLVRETRHVSVSDLRLTRLYGADI